MKRIASLSILFAALIEYAIWITTVLTARSRSFKEFFDPAHRTLLGSKFGDLKTYIEPSNAR
jgi:hypothetical protein